MYSVLCCILIAWQLQIIIQEHSIILVFPFPVYYAAQEGHLDCVHYLVEGAKADPHIPSTDGMTPLHAAAQTGRLHVTHWLVRSAKCPLTSRTCDGGTPVHFAAAKGMYLLLWGNLTGEPLKADTYYSHTFPYIITLSSGGSRGGFFGLEGTPIECGLLFLNGWSGGIDEKT